MKVYWGMAAWEKIRCREKKRVEKEKEKIA